MKEKEEKRYNKSLSLIAKSSGVVFIGVMLSKIFTYLYRIMVARALGPEIYGLFALAIMISGWFIAIAILGLGSGVSRYISIYRGEKKYQKVRSLFRSSIILVTLVGIISGIVLFLVSEEISIKIFNDPNLIPFIKFFSLAIPFSAVLSILLETLRSHEKISHFVFIGEFLINGLKVLLLGVFLWLGLGTNAVSLSFVLGTITTTLIAWFIIKYSLPHLSLRKTNQPEGKILKEVLSYSWPLVFVGMMWKLFHWTDSLFIGFYMSSTEVGIYNAVIPIAALFGVSLQLFMQLFFPIVNKEYARGNKLEVKQLSQQVGKWIFLISLPLFVLLMVFPDAFLTILFGEQYSGIASQNSLRLLSVGMLFYSISGVSEQLINTAGRSKLMFLDSVIIVILNAILNVIFIPFLGIVGGALSTGISLIVLSIIFMAQTSKILSIIPLRKKMLNIILAALLSSGIMIYINSLLGQGLIPKILASSTFLLSYLLFVLVLKGFDKNDWKTIKSIRRTKK